MGLKSVSRVLKVHFPQREYGMFFINAPVWCDKLFKIGKKLVAKSQIEKVQFFTKGAATENVLRELIHPDNLPSEYGGKGGPLGSAPLQVQKQRVALSGRRSLDPALSLQGLRGQFDSISRSVQDKLVDPR